MKIRDLTQIFFALFLTNKQYATQTRNRTIKLRIFVASFLVRQKTRNLKYFCCVFLFQFTVFLLRFSVSLRICFSRFLFHCVFVFPIFLLSAGTIRHHFCTWQFRHFTIQTVTQHKCASCSIVFLLPPPFVPLFFLFFV